MFTTQEIFSKEGKFKLTVGVMEDGFITNPREYDDVVEFTAREHRYYDLPKEFSFDWDAYDEGDMAEIEKMDKDYHIFFLDCYQHGNMVWSLAGGGIQCQFDTANRVGLMRVKKEQVEKREDALNLVKDAIETYNKWLSGEIYEWRIDRLVKWNSEDGREREEREYVDGCCGYYEEDEALESGLAEHKEFNFIVKNGEK